jgi:hypothetical protein
VGTTYFFLWDIISAETLYYFLTNELTPTTDANL